MTRPRAATAILRDDHILMIRHIYGGRDFWTLPGGGLEPGESFEQAAVRETLEEAGIAVQIIRFLLERPYIAGMEQIFLAEIIGEQIPIPGIDPEIPFDSQWITEVRWQPLESMKEDRQVKLVIQALNDF
jgi:8-oxo-dGTP pyrophosphatase MutT (NUDIX family)